jgi:hypothetical protein
MVQRPPNTTPPYDPTPDSHPKKYTTSNKRVELWSTYALNKSSNHLPRGTPPLRHSQRHAEQLSRIQLRYTLTGELDPVIT